MSSHRALMQLPRASRLLLMFAPSMSLIPRLLVLEARSLPARSIKESLAMLISAFIPCALSLCSTVIYSTACDREDVSLASVRSFVLSRFPYLMYFAISSTLVVMISVTPATQTPFILSSLSSRYAFSSSFYASRSLMFSL